MPKYKLILGECIAKMKAIPSNSIDLVLTDPPYGTTACKWDSVIPFTQMWEQLCRVAKKDAAIVLFGSQPFTSALVMSNPKMFKYEWVWVKNTQTGMMLAGKMPMKKHENILVFSSGSPKFNEEKVLGSETSQNHSRKGYGGYKNTKSDIYGVDGGTNIVWSEFVHANSVLKFNAVGNRDKNKFHPTQKPVELMEYLVRTYSDENDVVLDFTMGVGSTGVACKNLNRNFIGIEIDKKYFDIAEKRIKG